MMNRVGVENGNTKDSAASHVKKIFARYDARKQATAGLLKRSLPHQQHRTAPRQTAAKWFVRPEGCMGIGSIVAHKLYDIESGERPAASAATTPAMRRCAMQRIATENYGQEVESC